MIRVSFAFGSDIFIMFVEDMFDIFDIIVDVFEVILELKLSGIGVMYIKIFKNL